MARVILSRYFHRGFQVRFHKRSVLVYFAVLGPLILSQPSFAESSIPRALDISPARQSSEINFAPGQDSLDPFARQALDQLIREANAAGKIEQVKVFSWGDANASATPKTSDSELAASRARAVETYLNGKGIGLSVQTYNITSHPSALEDLKNSADPNVKISLDRAGVTTSTKPSRVVVMLVTRGN